MIRTLTDPNTQFIQNNSTKNNFSHFIKYTNPSKNNKSYVNKPILYKIKKNFFPKINLLDDDNSSNSLNETHINNYLLNVRHTNQNNYSKIPINKSFETFPRFISTERGTKQITERASDFDKKNNNSYQYINMKKDTEIKTIEGYNYSRRSRGSILPESSSMSSLHLINSNLKESGINGKKLSSRIIFKTKNEFDNIETNNESNFNYEKYFKNKDNYNTLDRKRNSCHYSLSNINQKKESNNFVPNTQLKTKEEEKSRNYKTNIDFKNKNNYFNLSSKRISNLSSSNITTHYIVNTKKKSDTALNAIKITRNKKNHVIYESKYTKTEKLKEKNISFIAKNKNENNNKDKKNIIKSPTYTNLKKIIKIKENLNNETKKDKNKDDEIKQDINRDKEIIIEEYNKSVKVLYSKNIEDKNKEDKTLNKINKILLIKNNELNFEKKESNENQQISCDKKTEFDEKNNIINNQVNNLYINNNKDNAILDNKIEEQKNSLNKLDKNENFKACSTINIKINEKNEIKEKNENIIINKDDIIDMKPVKNIVSRNLNNEKEEKEKDNNFQNNNIFEICKSDEIILDDIEKKYNEILQNKTANGNIIIIINNSNNKKISQIIKTLKKIDKDDKNIEINKKSNTDKKSNNQTDINNKVLDASSKKGKIDKNLKRDKKIEKKPLKLESNIKKVNNNDNNEINNIPNNKKISKNLNQDKISKENKKKENNPIINDTAETSLTNNKENSNIEKEKTRLDKMKESDKNKTINDKEENQILKPLKTPNNEESNIVWNNTYKISKRLKYKLDPERNFNSSNKNDISISNNKKEENIEKSEEPVEQENKDSPRDSISRLRKKSQDKSSNIEITQDIVDSLLNYSNSEKNEMNAISNSNIEEPLNQNQEQENDINNDNYKPKEFKAVIQHNIERKRPVFAIPPNNNIPISQEKNFHLIQKYYDENFILEDDEEEGFKQYIYVNEDGFDESIDNIKNNFRNHQ